MAAKVPSFRLNSGHDMPMIGLGTWKSKPGEVESAVKAALDAGYRHIDCAYIYQNEDEVGAALKEKLDEGKVTRGDVFVVSKLWNSYHRSSEVKPTLRESLRKLQLDFLDLYLIHWPHAHVSGKGLFPRDENGELMFEDIDPLETYKALEECVDEGLVKAIGLSNFNSQQVDHIVQNSRIKPAVNQVEIHPYFSNNKLVQHCLRHGVGVTAYSPLGSADRPWATADEPTLLNDPKLNELAAKHKRSPAQVVLRWLIQRNIIVIPKSVTPSRIEENFNIFDFELSDEDMATVNSYNRDLRLVVPFKEVDGKRVMRDRDAPNFPFNIEY